MNCRWLILTLFCIGELTIVMAISRKNARNGNNGALDVYTCTLEDEDFDPITISHDEIKKIGEKIWHNECRGTIQGLTSWNDGEDFASFGIGHFISYPQGKTGVFKETFPTLLLFLEKNKKKIPGGILKHGTTACPWNSRNEFMQNSSHKAMVALRNYLADTVDLQALFMVKRLIKALPIMLKKLPSAKKNHIKKQFYRLAKSPGGLYALVDYVNFKGEGGSAAHEQYKGYRWGLLQVLEKMKGIQGGSSALEEFAQSAKDVLKGRVAHAPKDLQKKESQWLIGWNNRINTYIQ
jgi:hypothetical protein